MKKKQRIANLEERVAELERRVACLEAMSRYCHCDPSPRLPAEPDSIAPRLQPLYATSCANVLAAETMLSTTWLSAQDEAAWSEL